MKEIINPIIIFTILSVIFSCDLFIKKNPEDLLSNKITDQVSYSKIIQSSITLTNVSIMKIVISYDNKSLYYVDSSNNIYYCNINNDGYLEGFRNTGYQTFNFNLVILKNDKNIITSNIANPMYLDIYERNTESIAYKSHYDAPSQVNIFILTPDGKSIIASSGANNYYYYFNINNDSLSLTQSFQEMLFPVPSNIIPSKDGLFIYCIDSTGIMGIYKRNSNNGKLLRIINSSMPLTPYGGQFTAVMSNNQKYLYCSETTANYNFGKATRDINDGVSFYNKTTPYQYKIISSNGYGFLAISNDDKKIYTSDGSSFYSINLENNKIDFKYSLTASLNFIAVSKNDRFIYVGDNAGNIIIFKRTIE